MPYTKILPMIFTIYILCFFPQHIFSVAVGSTLEFYSLTPIPTAEDARKELATTLTQDLNQKKHLPECEVAHFIVTSQAQRPLVD